MSGWKAIDGTSEKRVWDMNPTERSSERDFRYGAYAEFFRGKGANVTMNGSQLIVETPKNNYLIEILPADPRFISVGILYEVIPGDLDRASWACYNAQARSLVAKARAEPERDGYRLHFAVEAVHDSAQAFMDVADIHFACVEDCRANFLNMMEQAIEDDALAWATQPRRP